MERGKAVKHNNSESSSNDIAAINDTKDAFKSCLNHEIDAQFYRVMPDTLFAQPAPNMIKLFHSAEDSAIKHGHAKITVMMEAATQSKNWDDTDTSIASLPIVHNDEYETLDENSDEEDGQEDFSHIPTNNQLSQFVLCLKKCLPFVNSLQVYDGAEFLNCWCPMCPAVIDWTKEQCVDFADMVQPCTQKGRFKSSVIYGHLKEKKNVYFTRLLLII